MARTTGARPATFRVATLSLAGGILGDRGQLRLGLVSSRMGGTDGWDGPRLVVLGRVEDSGIHGVVLDAMFIAALLYIYIYKDV